MTRTVSIKWTLIEDEDTHGLDLRNDRHIQGPLNNLGFLCPWPWEVGNADFDPDVTHECSYCGQQSTPGMEHPDYRGFVAERKQE